MAASWIAFVALLAADLAAAAPTTLPERSLFPSAYAPVAASCPSTPLVRSASGLSAAETSWLAGRKPVASKALAAWLHKVDASFDTSTVPTVGLTTSGGGFRSFLTGAGVVKALDSRDSTSGTSGLWQGLTYHAGLSGGSWLVSGLAGNGWQTVSALTSALWSPALNEGLFTAEFSIFNPTYALIINDLVAKKQAGFDIVLDDVWGRLLSEVLLEGSDGDAAETFSKVAGSSPFTSFGVPFPLITAIGVDTAAGQCIPPLSATQYEISPYEFGSWDTGVDAFTQTKYLGSKLSNGKPASGSKACTTGFDNLGYVLGTSSNLFNEVCSAASGVSSSSIPPVILDIFEAVEGDLSLSAEYAEYPNPFYKLSGTSADISAATDLDLVDGGETDQNDPIWPFLQPARSVDVLIVNDNSADTSDNYPNGSELYETYQRAQQVGLSKMPTIPSTSYFTNPAVVGRPTFFGCSSTQQLTIVYVPNTNYTFDSGQSTEKLQYTTAETAGMISNGAEVATKNGDQAWPECLACAIMQKTAATLPSACTACLKEYCYTG